MPRHASFCPFVFEKIRILKRFECIFKFDRSAMSIFYSTDFLFHSSAFDGELIFRDNFQFRSGRYLGVQKKSCMLGGKTGENRKTVGKRAES